MENEIWKDIEGFEGLYQISNKGRVFSFRTNKFLKPSTDKVGYMRFCLQKTHRKDTKNFYIHRLVAKAFIPNFDNKPYINHKDENKQNNCVENLEWCTHLENINYGTRNERIGKSNKNSKYFSKKVKCLTTNIIYESMSEASRQTNIALSNICKCCNGERKFAGGMQWARI